MSVQARRADVFKIINSTEKRQSVTAEENRSSQNLIFSPEEMENIKLNNLREKRKELQEKLKFVSNKINFRKKKQEQELRSFIRSEQKNINLMETHNYKKFNEMLKEEFEHKRQFQYKRKAKEVEEQRTYNQRRLSLITQAVKDKKQEQSEKLRHAKKIDEQTLKYTRQMAFSAKKEKHQVINKMKERQYAKKRCFWFQKRISFQQKLEKEAQIYEKQVQKYYLKIQSLKESQDRLREQELEAQQVLKNADHNFDLLKNS